MDVARAIQEILPPAVVSIGARLLRPGFRGDYPDFDTALRHSTGYNSAVIAAAAAGANRPPARPWLTSRDQQVLAALVPAIRRHPDRLSVLDVGGAAGHYYHALRSLLPPLHWTILETPEMVRACRGTNDIVYVDDASLLAPRYDVVLLSGVLQYLHDPYAELSRFCTLGGYTVLNRLPLTRRDRITVQHIQAPCPASYPAWFLDESRFVAAASACGAIRMRWEVPEDRPFLDGRRITYQGMLLERA